MANIDDLLQLNVELEGLLHVLSHRDSIEARKALAEKFHRYSSLITDYIADGQVVPEDISDAAHELVNEGHYVEDKDQEAVETEVVPEIEAAEEAVAREEAEDAEPVAQKEAVEPEHGVRNLLRGMTMNDKYLYIREVFGGDEDDFTQTMSVIGDLPDYDIAYDYLVNDLLLNPDEPAVAQLLEYLNKEM